MILLLVLPVLKALLVRRVRKASPATLVLWVRLDLRGSPARPVLKASKGSRVIRVIEGISARPGLKASKESKATVVMPVHKDRRVPRDRLGLKVRPALLVQPAQSLDRKARLVLSVLLARQVRQVQPVQHQPSPVPKVCKVFRVHKATPLKTWSRQRHLVPSR